jgi:hypothetical protein
MDFDRQILSKSQAGHVSALVKCTGKYSRDAGHSLSVYLACSSAGVVYNVAKHLVFHGDCQIHHQRLFYACISCVNVDSDFSNIVFSGTVIVAGSSRHMPYLALLQTQIDKMMSL